jgi:glycosyltransferase involved in cell wall biosynthesis
MGEWYEAADLYVLTSRFEGFPNTLCEALAYGLPVVSVDCETGPRDLVQNEINGLLVPENDPDALVEALERLMKDEQLRYRLAAHSTAIQDKLSLQRVAGDWERLFSEIIDYGR